MNTTRTYFDHQKLIAYQRSIQFVAWSAPLLEKLSPKMAVIDQLDRASTSVPLNIAEGNAKYTPPDRCRYFDSARGSALECAACLDVLVAKGKCTAEQIGTGKQILHETVSLPIDQEHLSRPVGRRSCRVQNINANLSKSKSRSRNFQIDGVFHQAVAPL